MKINITVEVESTEALVKILELGSGYSSCDYKIIEYQIVDNSKMKFKNRKKKT